MSLATAKAFAVAAYACDEASGNLIDQVNGYDATDNNTVGATTGKLDGARSFDGTEYFNKSDNADLSLGDEQCMVRAWVQLSNKSLIRTIIAKYNGGTDYYALYYYATSDRFVWEVGGGGAAHAVLANNFGSPSIDTWYLIHGWHNPTDNKIYISVDAGTPDEAAHSTGIGDSAVDLEIGRFNSINFYHAGLIDDVVILKGYHLDATERTEDYSAGDGIAFADWDAGDAYTPRRLALLGIG